MAFCASCGAPIEGPFCAKCGAAAGTAPPPGPAAPPPPGAYAPPTPAAPGLADNAAAALCYLLGIVGGIIFLVLAPYNQNKAIRFHAFQSIFLFIASMVIWIGWSIISSVIWHAAYYGFGFMFLLGSLIHLLLFVLWVYMIVMAFQGKKVVLPVIGPLAQQQA